jgi:hypothetical protein
MAGVVDCYIEKLPRQEDQLAAQRHKIGQFRQQLPECNHQLVNLKEDKELAKLKKGRRREGGSHQNANTKRAKLREGQNHKDRNDWNADDKVTKLDAGPNRFTRCHP